MDSITLDELTQHDAMMTRVDRKYLLRTREAEQVWAGLPSGTRVLEIGGMIRHKYNTTYYDTSGLDCYFDAAHKRRHRFKVRTRTYCSTGASFLELKTKGQRGVTVKERTPIDATGTHWAWLNTHRSITGCQSEDLAPVLDNTYIRTTLSPPDAGRATIDTDLVWRNEHGQIAGLDLVIVETKSGATPSLIDKLLWRHGHRPKRFSKFGCGMAALAPDLPANNWHRALTDYFERTTTHA